MESKAIARFMQDSILELKDFIVPPKEKDANKKGNMQNKENDIVKTKSNKEESVYQKLLINSSTEFKPKSCLKKSSLGQNPNRKSTGQSVRIREDRILSPINMNNSVQLKSSSKKPSLMKNSFEKPKVEKSNSPGKQDETEKKQVKKAKKEIPSKKIPVYPNHHNQKLLRKPFPEKKEENILSEITKQEKPSLRIQIPTLSDELLISSSPSGGILAKIEQRLLDEHKFAALYSMYKDKDKEKAAALMNLYKGTLSAKSSSRSLLSPLNIGNSLLELSCSTKCER